MIDIVSISRDMTLRWLRLFAEAIAANRDELVRLDQAIGDGDHGANMHRGMEAVMSKLPAVADKDIGTIFKTCGMALISSVGGASGPLYGTIFIRLSSTTDGKLELSLADWATAWNAALEGVVARGKAEVGDKTMVDALTPALAALQASARAHEPIPSALQAAAAAADAGRDSTIPLLARKGRASYLGERSIGFLDPGATSLALLMHAAAESVAQ